MVTFGALAASQPVVRARFAHPVRETVEVLTLLVVLVGAVLLSSRLLDRRPLGEFGLSLDRAWWHSFAAGGLIATGINAGALAVAVGAGWATIAGFTQGSGDLSFAPAVTLVFCYVATAAAWEEVTIRGAMLKNVAEGAEGYLPRWAAVGLAVCLSTAVFAFLHGGKISAPSQYGYYLVAGLVLSGAYVVTGDLALSIGFHVFYNFTQSVVFGLGHSQQTPELLVVELAGPERWTGEEGLVFALFAVLGGVFVLLYVRRRDGSLRIDDRVTRWTPLQE
ncbi:CPBP family intramembrane glutamic endopeptidase [Haloarcula limicola]|uniref:CPBP family intramembrane glutamic endopeptidase n=1 Tax=Haloarcula limicola TaxID=1429915 RepID=UPI001F50BB20|nr:CPBP family intramembrane glutamic endopeptidase [Halomicroarcula limicola]